MADETTEVEAATNTAAAPPPLETVTLGTQTVADMQKKFRHQVICTRGNNEEVLNTNLVFFSSSARRAIASSGRRLSSAEMVSMSKQGSELAELRKVWVMENLISCYFDILSKDFGDNGLKFYGLS